MPEKKSVKKAKPRCPKGTIRSKAGRCVPIDGPTGRKLVKDRDAKKAKKSGSGNSKTFTKTESEWPKPFPMKNLDYLNTKKYKPSVSKVRKTAEKYAEKYKKDSETVASVIMAGTIISLITIPLILTYLLEF